MFAIQCPSDVYKRQISFFYAGCRCCWRAAWSGTTEMRWKISTLPEPGCSSPTRATSSTAMPRCRTTTPKPDVYKRQVRNLGRFDVVLPLQRYGSPERNVPGSVPCNVAVSYTHLDVYKRQCPKNATRYTRIAKKLVTGRTGSVAPSAFN